MYVFTKNLPSVSPRAEETATGKAVGEGTAATSLKGTVYINFRTSLVLWPLMGQGHDEAFYL